MTGYLVIGAIAVVMLVFGRWGHTHAANLAAGEQRSQRRSRKEKSLRRGAIVWQLVGVLILTLAVVGAITRQ